MKASGNPFETPINQAGVLLQQNQPLAAAGVLKKALELQPHANELRIALAFALTRAGNQQQAIETLQQGLQAAPEDPELASNLAGLLSSTGQFSEAVKIYSRMLSNQGSTADIHNQLAGCHMGLRQFFQAGKALEQSLNLDPGQLEPWLLLGQIYLGYTDTTRALTAFERAIEVQPQDLRAYQQLAQLHENSGQLEPALAVIKRGLLLEPSDGALLALQGRCLRLNGDSGAALETLKRVETDAVNDLIATSCHHELARIHHQQGQFEDAWRQFELSGQRAMQAAERQKTRGEVFFTLEKRWAALAPVVAGKPQDSKPAPCFIAGFPRSGTTLLDQFLSGHPRIRTMEEQPFLNDLVTRRQAGEKLLPDQLHQLTDRDCQALRSRYWQAGDRLLEGAGDSQVIDRTPVNFIHLPLIVKLWPDSRIVFILRHPLDVCLSCFMQHFALNTLTVNFTSINNTVALYQAMMQRWACYREQYSSNILELRYEQLVTDPETSLRRVLAAIELEWDPGVLDHLATSSKRRRIRTASYQQVRQAIHTRAIDRWQRYRPQLQAATVSLRQLTIDLGYPDPIGELE